MGFLKRVQPRVDRRREQVYDDDLFVAARHIEKPTECIFYHTIDLPEFGLQQGQWDLRGRFKDYIGHVDVEGKRVLDVGTASGFLSFETERAGASEVVSFDLDSARRQTLLPFAGSDYVDDHAKWCIVQTQGFKYWKNAYWLAHRLYASKAKVVYGDVYDLPSRLGYFDVVIVGAILEHLVDPLSALFSLSRHARDVIVINTDFLDTPGHMAAFKGRADRPDGTYIFWTYSIATYDEYMKIMGFVPADQRKDRFPGIPSVSDGERPMVDRVALVYRRDTQAAPIKDPIPERVRR